MGGSACLASGFYVKLTHNEESGTTSPKAAVNKQNDRGKRRAMENQVKRGALRAHGHRGS